MGHKSACPLFPTLQALTGRSLTHIITRAAGSHENRRSKETISLYYGRFALVIADLLKPHVCSQESSSQISIAPESPDITFHLRTEECR